MFKQRAGKVILIAVGLLFVAGSYPLATSLMHSGSEYEGMLLSLYVTLGVFLLLAVRRPPEHRSLIGFAAWSSFAHAAVMAVQSLHNAHDRADLLGGTVFFGIVWLALLLVAPGKPAAERASATGA